MDADTTRTAHITMGEPVDEKARRVRSLLSSYYKIDAEPGQSDDGAHGDRGGGETLQAPASASSASTTSSALGKGAGSLDSQHFDVDRYFQNVLEKTRLFDLLDREMTLASEVRTYDGDMQMLVYENYNKFISATDTIRSMRSKVDDMEDKMKKVRSAVADISEANDAVDVKMEERRDRFDSLNSVRSIMKKLSQVFELPSKINLAVESGALEVAVKYVASARPFLDAYSTGTLAEVKHSVAASSTRLVSLLKEQMVANPDDCAETIALLRQLGEPVSDLEDAFLASSRKALEGLARSIGSHIDNLPPVSQVPNASPTAGAAGGDGESKEADETLSGFRDAFASLVDVFLPLAVRSREQYANLFPSHPSGGIRELELDVAKVVAAVVAKVKQYMCNHASTSPAREGVLPPPRFVVGVLSGLNRALGQVEAVFQGDGMHSGDVDLEVSALLADCHECSLRNYVGMDFLGLEANLKNALDLAADAVPLQASSGDEASEALKAKFVEVFSGAQSSVHRCIDASVSRLRDLYAQAEASGLMEEWGEAFPGFVKEGFYQVLATTSQAAEAIPPVSCRGEKRHPAAWLVLAQILRSMSSDVVPKLDQQLKAAFAKESASSGQLSSRLAQLRKDSLDSASDKLLQQYVSMEGREMSKKVKSSLLHEDVDSVCSEVAVHPVFYAICDHFARVSACVDALLPEDGRKVKKAEHERGRSLGGSASGSDVVLSSRMERNVDRLFADKIKIFGDVKASQAGVLIGIAKIVLKSLVECIRLKTLPDEPSFQVITVSAAFLRGRLQKVMGHDDAVDYLMDEVTSAAADRSMQVNQMLPADMDRILTNS